ncbi:hypothetical protein IFVP22_C230270 [Vibrio parahaemolyticus]
MLITLNQLGKKTLAANIKKNTINVNFQLVIFVFRFCLSQRWSFCLHRL